VREGEGRKRRNSTPDVLSSNMLIAYFQRFSAVAVISSVVLALLAVMPTIILCVHGLVLHLGGCPDGKRDETLTGCGLLPTGFASTGTISCVASSFDTPQGRVFFGCMLLSSITLFISQFPFWLPRRPVWRLRQPASSHPWLDEMEGRNRFIWLFAGSLFMAVVSMVNVPHDRLLGYNIVPSAIHMGGFLSGIGVLLFMEFYHLHFVELAFLRWPPYRLWRGAELPAWVERGGQNPRELGELKWDQRWRCALWTAGIGSCAALVALQTPLALAASFDSVHFLIACGSVFAEGMVGLCVYGGLFVLAVWRLQVVRRAEGRRSPHYEDRAEDELPAAQLSSPHRMSSESLRALASQRRNKVD